MEVLINERYNKIKKKLMGLFILNSTDIILTLLLLKTGLFVEANVLMVNVVKSPIISLFLKVILVGVLLIYVYKRMRKATERQLILSNIIINFALVLYFLINLSHFLWVILYLTI